MSALAEVKAHHGIAGLEDSHGDSHVGLGAGVRLHVGPAGAVDSFQTVDSQLLYLIYHLTSSIVALARVALCIFIGADGPHGLEHIVRYIVLGRNQLQSAALTLGLFFD